jgi:hypothetical protein
LTLNTSLVDSTSGSTRIRIGVDFLDETGLQTATVSCSLTSSGITYVAVSGVFTQSGAKDTFDNTPLPGFSFEGDPRFGTVTADYDILKGAFPGIYACNIRLVDILNHESTVVNFTTFEVIRAGTGWDDRAPIPTLVQFTPSTIDTSPGANVSTLHLVVEDQTGIDWGYFTCESEGRRGVEMIYNRSGLYNYRTGVHTSPTRSSPTLLEFSAPIEVPTTQSPGIYSCYTSGRDTLRHEERVNDVGSLTVTDSLGSVDVSPPSLVSSSASVSAVEVGVESALVMLSFHLRDASPLGWSYVSCDYFDGTNHRILDGGFEPNRFYDYVNGWIPGASFSGTSSDMEFTFPLGIPKATYPGKYDCRINARDNLGNFKSYALASVTVRRTPAGQPLSPLSLSGNSTRPTDLALLWSAPSDLGSPVLIDYVVQYSTDGLVWTTINDGFSATPSLPLSNLKVDTDYWFRVRGENGGTVGQDTTYMSLSWSDILQIRTPIATVPDAPTGLSAASVTSSAAALSWTAPAYNGGASISNFTVETSRDGGSTWAVVPHVTSTSVTLALSGLAPGTRYEVRVAAINGVGRSDYLIGSVTTAAVAASAPRTVTASLVTPFSLTLSWLIPLSNGGAAITDYKVEVSSNSGTTWTSIPHTASNSLSFNVTSLNRATSYRFRVSAINSFGAGALSNVLTVSTLADVPAVPGAVTVSNVTSSSAVLAWTVPANNGGSALTDYKVETSRDGVTWTAVPHTASTLLGLTLSGLARGTQYQVRVSAINAIGASRTYSTATLTTLTTAASVPRFVTATLVTSSSLRLSWLIPSSNGGAAITDYKVEVSSNGGTTWTAIPHTASNSLSFNVTQLRRATSYKFRVSAVTSFGAGTLSNELTVSTLADVPAVPGAVTVSNVTSSGAKLAWAVPANNGGSALTDFKVETSRDGVTWTAVPHTASTLLGLRLSGLAPGTQYQVRVSAINAIGASRTYSTATLTTLTTAASAPRFVTASLVTSSSLRLSWLIPSSNGGASITNYKIEVSSNGGTTWTSIPHTASNSLSFNVTQLRPATSYRFRVSAITSFGAGALSNVLTVQTSL